MRKIYSSEGARVFTQPLPFRGSTLGPKLRAPLATWGLLHGRDEGEYASIRKLGTMKIGGRRATYSPLATTGSGQKSGRGFGEQVITFGMVLSHATLGELKCYLSLPFSPWLVLKIDGRNQASRKCSLTRSSIAFRFRTALITPMYKIERKRFGVVNIEFQESLKMKHITK